MNITKNKLANYFYNSENKTLYWHWFAETGDVSWEVMREEMIEYVEAAEQCKAPYHLIDERKQNFMFVPEMQIWIDKNISTRTIVSGCKKFALIKSQNIFIEVAAQQIFDEKNSNKIEMQMFDNIVDAENWLKKFDN